MGDEKKERKPGVLYVLCCWRARQRERERAGKGKEDANLLRTGAVPDATSGLGLLLLLEGKGKVQTWMKLEGWRKDARELERDGAWK